MEMGKSVSRTVYDKSIKSLPGKKYATIFPNLIETRLIFNKTVWAFERESEDIWKKNIVSIQSISILIDLVN